MLLDPLVTAIEIVGSYRRHASLLELSHCSFETHRRRIRIFHARVGVFDFTVCAVNALVFPRDIADNLSHSVTARLQRIKTRGGGTLEWTK